MKRFLWLALLLIAVGGYVGYGRMSAGAGKKPEAGRRAEGRPAVPVKVASVVQKAVPVQLESVATVEAYSTVSIRAQVAGAVNKVHFTQGQDVNKGDLLFTIDPRPFEATLKQSTANLQKDSAQLANALEQDRRYAELVKRQLISQEQYDQIRTNADALQASVEADKAAVENAKVQLSYCYIYSPIVGRTGSLLVNEGNLVRTNDATPLVILNQVAPIYVTFSAPESYLAEIKKRTGEGALKVRAVTPDTTERPEEGTLTFIDNSVDASTGTIRLKATFPNVNRRLWPGQFVKAVLTLSDQPNAIVVPFQAVQAGQREQQVFVVKADRTVDLRAVNVSRTLNGEAIISKGLAAGETVVTDGQLLLGPGTKVQIRKEADS